MNNREFSQRELKYIMYIMGHKEKEGVFCERKMLFL